MTIGWGGGALMSRKKENYAYGSLKERLVIITVRQSRLSSKVRAIVPVPQSHFDFACSLWTY